MRVALITFFAVLAVFAPLTRLAAIEMDSSEDEESFVNFCSNSKRSHEEFNSTNRIRNSSSSNSAGSTLSTMTAAASAPQSEQGDSDVVVGKRRKRETIPETVQEDEGLMIVPVSLRTVTNRPPSLEITEESVDNSEMIPIDPIVTPGSSESRKKKGGRPAGSKNKNQKVKTPKNSTTPEGAEMQQVAVDEINMEEWSKTLSSRNSEDFKKKLDAIGVDKMSATDAHKLILACMEKSKGSHLKYIISKGYRLILDPPRGAVIALFNKTMVDGKLEFLPSLLMDIDPVGTIKLVTLTHREFPESGILAKFKKALEKADFSIDPEAIQLAVETSADIKSLEIFQIFYESNLMIRMIPREKLLNLLTIPEDKNEELFTKILTKLIEERKLSDPYELNILSMAAFIGNYNFLDVIEPYLNRFTWDVAIQAVTLALKNGHLSFAKILLRTSSYLKCDYLFRLVTEIEFINVLSRYANAEIINRIVSAVYFDGTEMILSDLSLMKLFLKGVEMGSIEIVDYFVRNGIVAIGIRFGGKSIFRIALERKQFTLAKYMIKMLDYSIHDSDTYNINPPHLGGDSLIYVAENSSIEMFSYLLRLGANPNVVVTDDFGCFVNLIYWCIMKGQELLVKELLKHNCTVDYSTATDYNTHPEKKFVINEILKEHFSKIQK